METQEELVNKIVVNVPPGKLGIHLVDLSLSGGAKITAVNHDSALAGKVLPGDKLVKINEVDCSEMNVEGRYLQSLFPFILLFSQLISSYSTTPQKYLVCLAGSLVCLGL